MKSILKPSQVRAFLQKALETNADVSELSDKINSIKYAITWAVQNKYLDPADFEEINKVLNEFEKIHVIKPLQKKSILERFHQYSSERLRQLKDRTYSLSVGKSSNAVLNYPENDIRKYIAGLALIVFTSVLAAGLYTRFFVKTSTPFAFPTNLTRAGRILSFQGRLTDSLGNPITTSTNVQFNLYSASSGGSPLYSTGTCSVTPDQDGIFNTLIGDDCGSEVDSSIFSENTDIYLGTTVGADNEMTPRQQIANVGYAINAETLQGFPPGTNPSNIPYINKDGDLLINATAPGVRSTYASTNFSISSDAGINITAANSGDISLDASGSGSLVFKNSTHTSTFNSSGDLKIGGGSFGNASGNEDVYVTGNIEADGIIYGDGSGLSSIGQSNITDDSLDFADFQDTLDLDANLTLNQGASSWAQNFTGTTGPALTYTASGAVGSGNAAGIELNVSNASTSVPAMIITNNGSSQSLRINDNGSTSDSTPFVVDSDGDVGIGTDNPSYPLEISRTNSLTSGALYGQLNSFTLAASSASNATYAGLGVSTNIASGNAQNYSGNTYGMFFNIDHGGSGTVSNAIGMQGKVTNRSGTTSNATGIYSKVQNLNVGTITQGFGINVDSPANSGGGTFGTYYGIYVADSLAAASNYSLVTNAGNVVFNEGGDANTDLRVEGDTNPALFFVDSSADKIGIGTSSPGAALDIVGDVYVSSGISTFGTAVSDDTIEATKFCTGDGETNCVTDFSTLSGSANIWTDGGSYIYTTNSEVLGNSTSGGSNKITGLYLADSSPLYFGTDNDINLSFSGTALNVTQGNNDVNFDANTLFIDGSANNIGIGTTTPGTSLEVRGNHVSGKGILYINANSGQNAYGVINADAGNEAGFRLASGGTTKWYFYRPANSEDWVFSDAVGDKITFQQTTGNVGIGTTNPTALLSVGNASQFKVNTSGAVTAVGINSGSGLLEGTGGLTLTGTGNINASGTAATNIGNSTGTLALVGGSSSSIDFGNFDVGANGNISTAGDLAVNGDDISSDGNLSISATGYTRIGDTASPGSANGDDDLYVEGDIEADGTVYAPTLNINNDAFTDLTGTGLQISGGALQTTLGTSVDQASEVTGVLPLSNGGTNKNLTASNGQVIYSDSDSFEITTGGTTGQCLQYNSGSAPTWGPCLNSNTLPWSSLTTPTTSLSVAHADYDTVFTWDTPATSVARDAFTLGYTVDASTDATVQRLLVLENNNDGGSTGTLERLLTLDNLDTNEAVTTALEIASTGGGAVTTAIDASDSDIGTALSTGTNDLSGTNWNITGSTGAGVFVGVNAGAGLLQGTGGLTLTGTAAINTTGTAGTTIGNNSAATTVAITGGDAWSLNANGVLTLSADSTQTTALVITDGDYTNALSIADNNILGTTAGIDFTNFDVATNGNITIAAGQGLDTNGSGALNIGTTTQTALTLGRAGGTTTINGSSLSIGPTSWTATPTISGLITATSGLTANGALTANLTFTLGDNGDAGSINTNDWDISTSGDLSGIGTIGANGNITLTKADPSIIFDTTTALDTDYWIGVVEDAGGDDDDVFVIGDGITPGSASFLAVNTSGNIGIGTTAPNASLEVYSNTASSNPLIYANNGGSVGPDTRDFIKWNSGWGPLTGGIRAGGSWSWDTQIYNGTGLSFSGDGYDAANPHMIINGSGAIGIGTTQPATKMHLQGSGVSGDLARMTIRSTDNQAGISFLSDNSGEAIVYSPDNTDKLVLYAGANDRLTVDSTGNVGIGISSPNYLLDVAGSINTSSGFRVNGTLGADISCAADRVLKTANISKGIVTSGACSVNSFTDIAENYGTYDPEIEAGDIVALDIEHSATPVMVDGKASSKSWVIKASNKLNGKLIGIISTQPDRILGEDIFSAAENPRPVALIGRVPAKVSTTNGRIGMGDPISSSNILGYGMKASQPGTIVGKAIQPFDPDNNIGEIIACPAGTPPGIVCGKILVFVNTSWHEPAGTLTSTGDLQLHNSIAKEAVYTGNVTEDSRTILDGTYSLVDTSGHAVSSVLSAGHGLFGKIRTGLIDTQNAVVDGTLVAANAVTTTLQSTSIKTVSLIASSINSDNLSVSEKITSPVIDTDSLFVKETAKAQRLETNVIKPQTNDLTIDLNITPTPSHAGEASGPLARLLIKGREGRNVASIDAGGNATFSGTIAASQVQTDSVVTKEISSDTLTVQTGRINSLEGTEASLSGKLIAKEISAENIEKLASDVNSVQQLLADLQNQPLPDPEYYQNISDDTNFVRQNLTVTGNTNLYNAAVTNIFTAGNIMIENNSILALSSDLRLSALNTISLFDNAVVIAKNGTITTQGTLIAKDGLKTNKIQSADITKDVNVLLATAGTTDVATGQTINQNQKLAVTDSLGVEVASIDASGSARFNDIALNKYVDATSSATVIASAQNFTQNGIFAPAIETNLESAGLGVIPATEMEVIIFNKNISENSLIYLTPNQSIPNGQLSVVEKNTCINSTDVACKPYFKVSSGTISEQDLKFNWLIIN